MFVFFFSVTMKSQPTLEKLQSISQAILSFFLSLFMLTWHCCSHFRNVMEIQVSWSKTFFSAFWLPIEKFITSLTLRLIFIVKMIIIELKLKSISCQSFRITRIIELLIPTLTWISKYSHWACDTFLERKKTKHKRNFFDRKHKVTSNVLESWELNPDLS